MITGSGKFDFYLAHTSLRPYIHVKHVHILILYCRNAKKLPVAVEREDRMIQELRATRICYRLLPPNISPTCILFSNHLFLELASNALGNKRDISPAVTVLGRNLRQLVGARKHACAPASPSEEDIGVVVQYIKLLAHGRQTARVAGSAASLSQDCLALVRAQPVTECGESVDVVSSAGSVRTAVVRVEVLVYVEDKVCSAAVEVGYLNQCTARSV
jgi:hypothetical protein